MTLNKAVNDEQQVQVAIGRPQLESLKTYETDNLVVSRPNSQSLVATRTISSSTPLSTLRTSTKTTSTTRVAIVTLSRTVRVPVVIRTTVVNPPMTTSKPTQLGIQRTTTTTKSSTTKPTISSRTRASRRTRPTYFPFALAVLPDDNKADIDEGSLSLSFTSPSSEECIICPQVMPVCQCARKSDCVYVPQSCHHCAKFFCNGPIQTTFGQARLKDTPSNLARSGKGSRSKRLQ
ncbi:hypothetical protein PSACC_02812 [Paramicrosporidium saccamoebae]|uniref:Membrane anchor Opy2 N-terminal domain-containing protein n=1 Tax=Paramicrosporidium saccamoebae TaxID=1246581 RepID=A0A2H9TI95_9FUNG|nr:hypothetical protein PSACC_02812 [Paramicrosporidium saccamoebae]